ncbi:MAG: AI-2E family transporter [Pseudomonadota bacterium]
MTSQRPVLFWLAFGLLAIIAILTLSEILLPFVTGIVLAYAFNPVADRLQSIGLPRGIAAALVVAFLLTLIIALFVFVVPLLVTQIQQLVATLPQEIEKLRDVLEAWARSQLGDNFAAFKQMLDSSVAEFSENWTGVASVVAQSIWTQGQSIVSFISVLLITPVVTFYVLVDWHGMLARLNSWLPRDHADTLRSLASRIDEAISAFIRGQGLVCVILGIYYSVLLSAADLEYGLLIGILTGVLSFVPFVGWALGLISASVLAVIQGWPDLTLLAIVLTIFAGAQVLDAAFLSPKIVGSRIGLHPVWLIFALVTFSYLFGTVGVLVAVPLAAATGVIVRHALSVYLESEIYKGGKGSIADRDPAPVPAPPNEAQQAPALAADPPSPPTRFR